MKPTDEQIKEFWGLCGLEYKEMPVQVCGYQSKRYAWLQGDYFIDYTMPDIDLNNLFKYAVPKIPAPDYIKFRIRKEGYMCEVRSFGSQVNKYYYEDPALALFWALWQVKESK